MKNIATAFIKAKKEFGKVLKVSTNPHFKNKYAPLDVCIEAVDEACLNNGIAMIQETSQDETGVTVETVFIHESGESLRCGKLHVPSDKMNAQGFGSALTYARRYSLLTSCGIAPEDDDGNAAGKTPPNKAAPMQTPQLLSAEQVAAVTALADEVKANIQKLWEYYGATSIETIQAGHYSHIIKTLEAKRKSA